MMFQSQTSAPVLVYTGAPYSVTLHDERRPFLSGHTAGDPTKEPETHLYYSIVTKIASVLGIICIVMSVVFTCLVLFTDSVDRLGYQTTTFLVTTERENPDSWQILTQSWSELIKNTPNTDIHFEHYYECMWKSRYGWGNCNNATVMDYKTCVSGVYATGLSTCATNNDEDHYMPTLNAYVQCLNTYFLPDRQAIEGMKVCLQTNSWPMYESPESVDSWYFLGSFNWILLLSIGFALFSCFALYASGFSLTKEDTKFQNGVVTNSKGPASYIITMGAAVFACLFFFFALINSYRILGPTAFGVTYGLPNSVATNTVISAACLMVIAYFLAEFLNHWSSASNKQSSEQHVLIAPSGEAHMGVKFPYHAHATTFHDKINAYYPVLSITWTNAYLLDPIIVAGILGATHQLTTVDIYQVFTALLAYRIAHTSGVRLIYEGYIKNPDETTSKDGKPNHDVYSVRFQALIMHLAAIMGLIMAIVVLSNPYRMISEFPLVIVVIYMWFFIPELIRILCHLKVAVQHETSMVNAYTLWCVNYFTWIWDVVVRLIVIIIVFWGQNTVMGTRAFINTRLQNITDTIAYTAS